MPHTADAQSAIAPKIRIAHTRFLIVCWLVMAFVFRLVRTL